ncbi:MAG TPA: hypothetical protein DCP91_11100 [Eggerthellaceae bacterium]|nr:hypothetical protein [Eggerthellaceae bacterium]
MKMAKLIRYIDDTAAQGCLLYFYDGTDSWYSTGCAGFVSGEVVDSGGLYRGRWITLSFRASSEQAVSLQRDDLLAWLRELQAAYGGGVRVRIRLHGGRGVSRSDYRDMLASDVWGRIAHRGGGRYELVETVRPKRSVADVLSGALQAPKAALSPAG